MARKVLTPTGAGKPIGMYSAGFAVDPARLVFVAGQVAMDAVQNQDRAPFAEWRRAEYPKLFPDGVYPANTGVVVVELARPSLLLEVEAIAVRPDRPAAGSRRPQRSVARGARRRRP
jgi:enamine deaminase RidA (YjgF/YER057c/UK114 family)